MKKRHSHPRVKKGICSYHLCRKRTTVYRCKYCGRYFCKDHIDPLPVLSFYQVTTAEEPIRSELEKIWRSEKGHPCYPYTQIFWDNLEKAERERQEKEKEALDKLLKATTLSIIPTQKSSIKEFNGLQSKNMEGAIENKAKGSTTSRFKLVVILAGAILFHYSFSVFLSAFLGFILTFAILLLLYAYWLLDNLESNQQDRNTFIIISVITLGLPGMLLTLGFLDKEKGGWKWLLLGSALIFIEIIYLFVSDLILSILLGFLFAIIFTLIFGKFD
jgi:hypothetical protein